MSPVWQGDLSKGLRFIALMLAMVGLHMASEGGWEPGLLLLGGAALTLLVSARPAKAPRTQEVEPVEFTPFPEPVPEHPPTRPRSSSRTRHPVTKLRPTGGTVRCPYCRDDLDGLTHACAECGVVHHEECLVEIRGCTTLGCSNTPQRWRGVSQ